MRETVLRPGDVVADRFRVKEVLGAGPFGVVLRVLDLPADAELALKVFHSRFCTAPEDLARLATTLEKASKVSHPHLARVLETGRHGAQLFAVRQFVEGLSLRNAMERRRAKRQPFTLGEVEALVTQIAAALDAAHRTLAHGDLKAENVIVQPHWVKLTDLGLGLAIARTAFVAAHDDRNQVGLLAPEFQSTQPLDARTDTYALGVLIGELLAGVLPAAHVPSLSKLRPDLPGALEGLYRKALNEDPDARYQTPLELAEELSALAQRSGHKRSGTPTVPEVPVAATRKPAPQVRKQAADDPARPVDASMIPEGVSLPSGDETQPLDAELIAQAIAAKVAASAGAEVPPSGGPPSRGSPPPTRGPGPPGITQPLGLAEVPADAADQSPTIAMPSIPEEYLAGRTRLPAATTRRSRGTLWLILLTLLGLAGGTVGGTLLLQRLRRRPAPVNVSPVPPSRSPAARPKADDDAATPASPPKTGGAAATPVPGPRADGDAAMSATGPNVSDAAAAPASPTTPAPAAPCPDGMQHVKAGGFRMGTAADDPMMGFDERTLSAVDVGAFCIDQYEYPNRAKTLPRAQVSWHDATQLCEAVGKRLCTEAEWEKACKGPQGSRFPYGDAFDPAACNTETETGDDRPLAPAGGFARCRSGYGVFDLSGNVAEWTASAYAKDGERAQKGGASDRPDYASRCAARRSGPPAQRSDEVGFRCCADAR